MPTTNAIRERIQAIVDKAVDKAVRAVVAEKQAEIEALEFEVEQYSGQAAALGSDLQSARSRERVYRYATYAGFLAVGGSAGWTIGRLRGAGVGLAVGGAAALVLDLVTQAAVR